MHHATLTDTDGDRLIVHGTPEALFLTVSSEDGTRTAGGFARAQLDELLDAVVPPANGPAAERRPITADDIESVLHSILPLTTEHLQADDIANIASDLYTALIEPPRPEGAEELARLIADADVGEWDCGDLADALLATGRVRVVGEEQS